MAPCNIYLSHRRGDAVRQVGRIREKLGRLFGEETLFYGSHQAEDSGAYFRDGVRALVEARAILILIGPQWTSPENLELLHETDGQPDPVRRGILQALSRHAPGGPGAPLVLPILLDGATLPDRDAIPKELKLLTKLTPMLFPQDESQWPEWHEQLRCALEAALDLPHASRPSLLNRLLKPVAPIWPTRHE